MPIDTEQRIGSQGSFSVGGSSMHTVRVDSARTVHTAHRSEAKKRVQRRILVHALVFALSFIFTSGVAFLSVILWVHPDSPITLLSTGLFSGFVFVVSFATLRMFILHHYFNEYPNKEEDPGTSHHLAKSVSYGLVALVLAVVIVGLCINVASAGIL